MNNALLPGDKNYIAPALNSHQNIQTALTDLYRAFLAEKIDIKRATFGLHVLRLAEKTVSAIEKASRQSNPSLPKTAPVDPREFAKLEKELEAARKQPQPAASASPAAEPQPKRGIWDPYGCMSAK